MFSTNTELKSLKNWIKQNIDKDRHFSESYKIVFGKLQKDHQRQLDGYRKSGVVKKYGI